MLKPNNHLEVGANQNKLSTWNNFKLVAKFWDSFDKELYFRILEIKLKQQAND